MLIGGSSSVALPEAKSTILLPLKPPQGLHPEAARSLSLSGKITCAFQALACGFVLVASAQHKHQSSAIAPKASDPKYRNQISNHELTGMCDTLYLKQDTDHDNYDDGSRSSE